MAELQWTSVQSANIRAVAYEKDTETLYIRFDNGVYAYDGVEPVTYQSFLGAGSKGSFFHQNIKGSYPYSRV